MVGRRKRKPSLCFVPGALMLLLALSLRASPVRATEPRNLDRNETSLVAFQQGGDWGPNASPQSLFESSIWSGFVAEVIPDNGFADLITGRFRHPSRKFLMVPGGLVIASLVARVDMMMKIIMMRQAALPPPPRFWNQTSSGGSSSAGEVSLTPNFLYFITQAPIVYFLLKAGGALQLRTYQDGIMMSATVIYSNVGSLLVLAVGQLAIKLVVAALSRSPPSSNNLTSPFVHFLSIFVIPTAMHSAFYFTQEDLLDTASRPLVHDILVGVLVALFIAVFLAAIVSNALQARPESWRQVMSWWYAPLCPTRREYPHFAWVTSQFLLSAVLGTVGGNWVGAIFSGLPFPQQDGYAYSIITILLCSATSNFLALVFLPETRKLSAAAMLSDIATAVCAFPQLDLNVCGCTLAAVLYAWGVRAVVLHIIFPLVDGRTDVPPPQAFQQTLLEYAESLGVSHVDENGDPIDDDADRPRAIVSVPPALVEQVLLERHNSGLNCPRSSDRHSVQDEDADPSAVQLEGVQLRASTNTNGQDSNQSFITQSRNVRSESNFDPFDALTAEGSAQLAAGNPNDAARLTTLKSPNNTSPTPKPPSAGQIVSPQQTTAPPGIVSPGSAASPRSTPQNMPSLQRLQLPPVTQVSTPTSVARPNPTPTPTPTPPSTPASRAPPQNVFSPTAAPSIIELPPAWIRHLPDPNQALSAHQRRSSILRSSFDASSQDVGDWAQSFSSQLSPRSEGSSPVDSRNGSFSLHNRSSASSPSSKQERRVSFRSEDVADPSKHGSPKRRLSRTGKPADGLATNLISPPGSMRDRRPGAGGPLDASQL